MTKQPPVWDAKILNQIGQGDLAGLTWLELESTSADEPLGGPQVWVFEGLANVERALHLAEIGHEDLVEEPVAWAVAMAYQEDDQVRRVVVLDGPEGDPASVVAWVSVWMPMTANLSNASNFVGVHPRWRRRGLGKVLLQAGEALAQAEGRTVLQASTFLPGANGPQCDDEGQPWPTMKPKSGVGEAPLTPSVRWVLAHGYEMEQVDRQSTLSLPVEPELLDRLFAEAETKADGYRLHTWRGQVPDEWAEQFAALLQAMVDAPSAGLEYEEEPWDAARLRREEAEVTDEGLDQLHTVAEHIATGELAAFTTIQWNVPPIDRLREFAFQEDTLVTRAHRGHRLGMLVKVTNLREFAKIHPGAKRLRTWNAEENEHMLAINVALGFVPDGGDASFQRRV